MCGARFDEGSGTVAVNMATSTGTAFNGALVGGATYFANSGIASTTLWGANGTASSFGSFVTANGGGGGISGSIQPNANQGQRSALVLCFGA